MLTQDQCELEILIQPYKICFESGPLTNIKKVNIKTK
jgi:hypothetical protein